MHDVAFLQLLPLGPQGGSPTRLCIGLVGLDESVPRAERSCGHCWAQILQVAQVERKFAVRIAVATFGERVSPRFDCAQTFLIVTVGESRPSQLQHVFAADWGPHERINRLVALGVEAVVCGGIDLRSAELLQANGVKLYARRTGRIEDVLTSLFRVNEHSEREQESQANRP